MNKNYDIVFCEPFILPGILPTSGTATLKAMSQNIGAQSKVIYPSIAFFSKYKLYSNPSILELVEETPVQLVEFLFVKEEYVEASLDYICDNLNGTKYEGSHQHIREILVELRKNAITILNDLVDEICSYNPRILSCSTTFGDLNFDIFLWKKIKEKNKDIIIVCGGSNCSPQFSKSLFSASEDLDYVVCDEVGTITISMLRELLFGEKENPSYKDCIATKDINAKITNRLINLDCLPCPDFDDFMETAKSLSINTTMLTLPYEISRGCWWGEKHPCTMCGFFGTQQKFLSKDPQKVINELTFLSKKYGIKRFRFTDLVNPTKDMALSLLPLEELGLTLFWELRPDLDEEHLVLLKRIGLKSGQIGLESFSTKELCNINKGTSGIWNIYVLRLLSEYKVEVFWNYLFGFTNDQSEWYEEVLNIFPKLYHLQPPAIRKVWVNRYSTLFNQSDEKELLPMGDDVFHDGLNTDVNFFFKVKLKDSMSPIYWALSEQIGMWKKAFSRHYYLLVDYSNDHIIIKKAYPEEKKIVLDNPTSLLYEFLREPRTENDVINLFKDIDNAKDLLKRLLDEDLIVFMDNKYLALACFPTQYRWIGFYEQASYAGKRIYDI